MTGDLIDCARPGDEIDLTGYYTNNFDMSLNTKNGFPVFSTVIEANYVVMRKDVLGSQVLSSEDIQKVVNEWILYRNNNRIILFSITLLFIRLLTHSLYRFMNWLQTLILNVVCCAALLLLFSITIV